MAKYDSMRKSSRNEAIKKLHKEQPDLSLEEIGQMFRISKQRVSQIIASNGGK